MANDPEENPYVFESEVLSPVARLQPGESYTWRYQWSACRIGGDFPVVGCSDAGLISQPLTVRRKGVRSITYGFRISVDGREIAVGKSTSVCCELEPGRDVRAIPIPDFIADKIEEAPR